IPSSPRSEKLFTGRVRTVWTTPSTTCCTFPVAFSSTKKSFGPRKAMLVGWSRPETTVLTLRFGSTIVGPAGGGSEDGLTFKVPKRPCCSSSIPAVKKIVEELPGRPSPNWSAQTPGIVIGAPLELLTLPRKSPESKSNALIVPSPKLPTRSALSKPPKPSNGAQAIPHGELSSPLLVNRCSSLPCESELSIAITAWVGSTLLFQPAIVPSSVANSSVLGADWPPEEMTNPDVPLVATPVGDEEPVPPGAGMVTTVGDPDGIGWPVLS